MPDRTLDPKDMGVENAIMHACSLSIGYGVGREELRPEMESFRRDTIDWIKSQLDAKDTLILDLCAALSEIMEQTGDTETVFYIAQEALKAVYPEPDNMEAVWGGWV